MSLIEKRPAISEEPSPVNGEMGHLYGDLKNMKLELYLHYIEKVEQLQAGMHTARIGDGNVKIQLEHYRQEIEAALATDASDPRAMDMLERRYISVMNENADRQAAQSANIA